MHRLIYFMTAIMILAVVAATPAIADELRVSSDVVAAEIVLSGGAGSFGSAAPLYLSDIPSGRYEIEVFLHGHSLGHRSLDVGYENRLRASLASRWFLSTMIPGLGQWRDEGMEEAWTPALGSMIPLARSLHFSRIASDFSERASRLSAFAGSDSLAGLDRERALADANFAQETQEDYLRLFGYMHLGNVLSASVRRGPVQFHKGDGRSVQALYRPVSVPSAVVLSGLWPGLGQLRAGRRDRAKFWHLASLAWGVAIVELQREFDEDRRDFNVLRATGESGDPAFEQGMSRISGEMQDSKHLRNNVVALGLALWVVNLFDAAFSASSPDMDTDPSLVQGSGTTSWDVGMAWIGDSPAIQLSKQF